MKEVVCNAVKKFEVTGKIGKGYNSSFIALRSKVKDLVLILDFSQSAYLGVSIKLWQKFLRKD